MIISLETVLGFLSTRIEQDDLIKETRCSHNPEVHAQSIQLGQFSSKMATHALKTSIDRLFCDEISRASSATFGFLSIFQFETLQETDNLQARQCIFLSFFRQFALVDFHTISRNTTSKHALNDENYDDDSYHDQYEDGQ